MALGGAGAANKSIAIAAFPTAPPMSVVSSSSGSSSSSSHNNNKAQSTRSVRARAQAQKEDVSELSKFGLSSNDRVLESYSCALYPKKGILTHGRMFVLQHYLAFSSVFPETRLLISMREVRTVFACLFIPHVPNSPTSFFLNLTPAAITPRRLL